LSILRADAAWSRLLAKVLEQRVAACVLWRLEDVVEQRAQDSPDLGARDAQRGFYVAPVDGELGELEEQAALFHVAPNALDVPQILKRFVPCARDREVSLEQRERVG
jgi:hypothetical protein